MLFDKDIFCMIIVFPLFYYCSLDDTIGDYYYFNINSGETQWAHPLDEIYKQKVILARQEFEQVENNDAKAGPPNPNESGGQEINTKDQDVTEVSEDLDDNTSAEILSNLAKTAKEIDVPDPLATSSPMKLVRIEGL